MKLHPDSSAYENAISVQQMREADAYTIQHFTSGRELMFRAAHGVYDSAAWEDKRIAIVCGSGNNGMNGDTGEAELAVRSDLTVSIGFYKTGMFLGRASELIGELVNVDIGIVLPDENYMLEGAGEAILE